jgi:O-methyltransferase involved in polyketide biosynthesis
MFNLRSVYLIYFHLNIERAKQALLSIFIHFRLLALEHSFEKYVLLSSSLGQKFQVLSLGAGYDTTYFRFTLISQHKIYIFCLDNIKLKSSKFLGLSINDVMRAVTLKS